MITEHDEELLLRMWIEAKKEGGLKPEFQKMNDKELAEVLHRRLHSSHEESSRKDNKE